MRHQESLGIDADSDASLDFAVETHQVIVQPYVGRPSINDATRPKRKEKSREKRRDKS